MLGRQNLKTVCYATLLSWQAAGYDYNGKKWHVKGYVCGGSTFRHERLLHHLICFRCQCMVIFLKANSFCFIIILKFSTDNVSYYCLYLEQTASIITNFTATDCVLEMKIWPNEKNCYQKLSDATVTSKDYTQNKTQKASCLTRTAHTTSSSPSSLLQNCKKLIKC